MEKAPDLGGTGATHGTTDRGPQRIISSPATYGSPGL